MKKTTVKDLLSTPELMGTEVEAKGWVRTRRGNKHVQFVQLNDGSSVNNIQVVLDMARFTEDQLKPVTTGSSVRVTGKLVESMGKGQTSEIQADSIELYGTADPASYPCRRRGIPLSFCVRLRTCVRAPTSLVRCFASAALSPLLSISSSMSVVSIISILRLSQPAIARVPAQCSK